MTDSAPRVPGRARQVLRPFGYALVALVWIAILGACLLVAAALPLMLSDQPLGTSPGVTKLVTGGNPGEWIAFAISIVLLPVCFGILVMVVASCLAQIGLAITY